MVVERKPHLTEQAHALICEHFSSMYIKPKIAIDATCGNGSDTVFQAKYVTDTTYAFDIQKLALHNTQARLTTEGLEKKVQVIHAEHQVMHQFVKQASDIIMFNFGYLPQSDKSITTKTETSLQALSIALELLSETGILSLLCYPGHPEGERETIAIRNFLENLPTNIHVKEILSSYPNQKSPILFLLTHKK